MCHLHQHHQPSLKHMLLLSLTSTHQHHVPSYNATEQATSTDYNFLWTLLVASCSLLTRCCCCCLGVFKSVHFQ